METPQYSAFAGQRLLFIGALEDMLKAVKASVDSGNSDPILIFEDESGKQLDFDLRGSLEELLERNLPPKPRQGPGRPSLGVVSGEVSLLPRHWAWLEAQRHNVSATIRRLTEEAMKREPAAAKAAAIIEATDRVMWALAGDLPGCEEASRALYARDFPRFRGFLAAWPGDIGAHLAAMAAPAEAASPAETAGPADAPTGA